MDTRERLENATGKDADGWRELVKPLFMQMFRSGVRRIEIEKDGTLAKCRFYMDARTTDNEPEPIDL